MLEAGESDLKTYANPGRAMTKPALAES